MVKIFALQNSNNLFEKISSDKVKVGKIETKKFSDGEFKVTLKESVRGKRVILYSSLKTPYDIIEFLNACDAAHRSSAKEIIALIPYLPFMRQDRKDEPRTAIGAKVIANIIESVSVNQVITIDLHADQIEGFFNIPVTHLSGRSLFCPYMKEKHDLTNFCVVSPDVGGAKRAKKFSSELDLPLAIINKEREMANEVSSMELIGDVSGKKVIIVDDIVDTAGSLCKAVDLLLDNGAIEVFACITHGVLSGPAIERIKNSKLTKLYISDSLKVDSQDEGFLEKIEIVSCSSLFGKAVDIIGNNKSINKFIENM